MDIRAHRSKPNRLLTVLVQKQTVDPRQTYVIVEGQADYRIWSRFKADVSELIIAYGKQKLVAALRLVNRKFPQWQNVVAIVDADYWLIEDSDELNMKNMLYGDSPDLEVTLVNSPALEKVMRNTLPTDVEDSYARELRETAVRLATVYGYFRFLDYRHRELNLSFGQVSFEEVIDGQTLALNTRRVAEALATGSSDTAAELLKRVEELRREVAADIRLCRGHDVLSIMSCLIRFDNALSEKTKILLKSNELSRALRMAYEFAYFIKTALYRRIREWEAGHAPFRIIRDYPPERTPA